MKYVLRKLWVAVVYLNTRFIRKAAESLPNLEEYDHWVEKYHYFYNHFEKSGTWLHDHAF